MNKKHILLVIVIVVFILVVGVYLKRFQKNATVMGLSIERGVEITAPIQFKADENVTAIEVTVKGDVKEFKCVSKEFEIIIQDETSCTMANFNGGSKSGVIGSVTFVYNKDDKPLVLGELGNADGNDAKNGVVFVEY